MNVVIAKIFTRWTKACLRCVSTCFKGGLCKSLYKGALYSLNYWSINIILGFKISQSHYVM